jgi:hypothetical protein
VRQAGRHELNAMRKFRDYSIDRLGVAVEPDRIAPDRLTGRNGRSHGRTLEMDQRRILYLPALETRRQPARQPRWRAALPPNVGQLKLGRLRKLDVRIVGRGAPVKRASLPLRKLILQGHPGSRALAFEDRFDDFHVGDGVFDRRRNFGVVEDRL